MKKTLLLITYLLLLISNTNSFSIEEGLWTDFEGSLGGRKFHLSLYKLGADSVSGNYFFADEEVKYKVLGTYSKDILLLKEYNGKNFSGVLKARLYSTESADILKGFKVARNGGKPMRFEMSVSSKVGGTADKRYSDVQLSDEEVEGFAIQLKKAFKNNDIKWLADHISYPLSINLSGGKSKALKNKEEFIKNYHLLATVAFKKELMNTPCFNLFHNYQGIMMGNGIIWLNSDIENKRMLIIGVNN